MRRSAPERQTTERPAIAFAPATIANVAVGFDIMGFAIQGLGEVAHVERIRGLREVILAPVEGFPELSTDPEKNTATAGLVRLVREKKLKFGFKVTLHKKIPIGSGLGGSATSAVASLIAANELLERKLSRDELLDFALTGEEVASHSRHADNLAPCLYGGLVVVGHGPEFTIQRIPTPRSLTAVILLPELSIRTSESRGSLSPTVSLAQMVEQTANLSGFIVSCFNKDLKLMGRFLRDSVIEPQRARSIPHFLELQNSAFKSGALGCSISGSGPALFALAKDGASAKRIQRSWLKLAEAKALAITGSWISQISSQGAHIVKGLR